MAYSIPEDYIIQKFRQHCGAVTYNRYNNTYRGSCAICREGKSWLKKTRCYYILKKDLIYCHNCGWSSKSLKWLKEVEHKTFNDIKQDVLDFCGGTIDNSKDINGVCTEEEVVLIPTLPRDSINLCDSNQIEYYKNNSVIKKAIKVIKERKLDTAINTPKSFYISLTDFTHKNRLIIPFFDENNKIIFYQTRTILDNDPKERYISKVGSVKSLFNYNNISNDTENIFVFEGPINSCFCKNSVAVGGIQENSDILFTPKQKEQITKYPFVNIVWVLDSQWIDKAALEKSKRLIKQKQKVFIWPKKIGETNKDFNDLAIKYNLNEISPKFILKYTYEGVAAEFLLNQMH